MADPDAQRFVGKNFEGNRGIGYGFSVAKYVSFRELCVVSGAAAEKLVVTGSGNREVLQELFGVPGQSVGQKKSGAVVVGGVGHPPKRLDHAFDRSESVF